MVTVVLPGNLALAQLTYPETSLQPDANDHGGGSLPPQTPPPHSLPRQTPTPHNLPPQTPAPNRSFISKIFLKISIYLIFFPNLVPFTMITQHATNGVTHSPIAIFVIYK